MNSFLPFKLIKRKLRVWFSINGPVTYLRIGYEYSSFYSAAVVLKSLKERHALVRAYRQEESTMLKWEVAKESGDKETVVAPMS